MTTVKTNNVEGTQNDLTLKSNESNASSNLVLQSGTSGGVKFKQKDSATTFTLPTTDGTSGSKLITDGNGVLSFEGSGGGGSGPILPTTEKLMKTWDFNNYQLTAPVYGTTGLECVVPTSQAATPDLIEQFIWKFENLNFGVDVQANNVQGDFTTWIAPISTTGGTPILDSTNAGFYTYWSEYNKSTGNWNNRTTNYNRKDATQSVSGGSYANNDYGLCITGIPSGYGIIYTSNTGSSYHGPGIDANPFTDRTTNAGIHNRTNFCGEVKIYNTASGPDVQFSYKWHEPDGNNQQKPVRIEGISYNQISNNSDVYPVTTGHAQGYKFHFLPYTYSNRETTGIVSGRIELFVRLKEGAQSPSVT